MTTPEPVAVIFPCDGAAVPAAWAALEHARVRPLRHLGPRTDLSLRVQNLSAQALTSIDGVALDLVRIAAYVYVAEQLVSRGGEADVYGARWQRRLYLSIPVSDPELWSAAPVREALERLLRFLSDDQWRFAFTSAPAEARQLPLGDNPNRLNGNPDVVALFSGGADSLTAAAEAALAFGRRPMLVSHWSNDALRARQLNLAREFRAFVRGWDLPHIGMLVNRVQSDAADTNQRTRPFLFAAIGAAVARGLGLAEVLFADNGVVSVNLPFTFGQFGAQTTRSTHPRFLAEFNALLARLFPSAPRLRNPLWSRTRADTYRLLKGLDCSPLLAHAASCAHPRGRTSFQPHCGICSQCLDRRFAALRAGLTEHDLPERYELDIFRNNIPQGQARSLAVGYYNLALRLAETDERRYLSEFPQLMRCVAHLETNAEQGLDILIRMLKHHGEGVVAVMAEQMDRLRFEIARRRVPPFSLVRLVQGLVVPPGAAASLDQTGVDDRGIFRQEVGVYRLRFAEKEAVVPASVGMAYLRELLARPGIPIAALELIIRHGRGVGHAEQLPGQAGLDAALKDGFHVTQETASDAEIDDQARRDYAARLRDLVTDIAEAERNHDPERAVLLKEERDALVDALSASLNRHGRPRRQVDPDKRPRQAVAAAINRAYRTIARVHPYLVRHLQNSIRTGSECLYEPEASVTWLL